MTPAQFMVVFLTVAVLLMLAVFYRPLGERHKRPSQTRQQGSG